VNNAGIGNYHSTLTISKESIDEFFTLNVYGAIYMTQRVVPRMPKGGRIINISSITSKIGMGGMPMYGASKAALDSLTYAWAQEVRLPCLTGFIVETLN
jgi:NAD(P)-dependent dehydrogenase (short-subunit alcohol dehydrogenase family)